MGNLSVASIKVGNAYVAPSAEAAAKVVDLSKRVSGRASNDVAVDIDRTTTEAGAYPLILTSYVIACPTYADEAKASLVKGYLRCLLSGDGLDPFHHHFQFLVMRRPRGMVIGGPVPLAVAAI